MNNQQNGVGGSQGGRSGSVQGSEGLEGKEGLSGKGGIGKDKNLKDKDKSIDKEGGGGSCCQ
jgi:hypothetical protein